MKFGDDMTLAQFKHAIGYRAGVRFKDGSHASLVYATGGVPVYLRTTCKGLNVHTLTFPTAADLYFACYTQPLPGSSKGEET